MPAHQKSPWNKNFLPAMSSLTIASLNLRNRQNRWLQRRSLVVAELLDAQPDLISLQEIYMPIRQGYWLRNQLNNRTSGTKYRIIQARKRHPIKGYFEGIGILSRLPILASDIVSLGYEGRVALRANVMMPSGVALDFVSVHLHHLPQDQQARLEQTLRLISWLNDRNPVARQIIAGDFNEMPAAPAIRQMKALYQSAFEMARGYEPVATFPTALIDWHWGSCLDYIFLSSAIQQVNFARLFCQNPDLQDDSLFPSDHVGLLAQVEIEDNER